MGMSIDNIIQSLIAMKSVIGVNQLTINEAVETMRKYQKIEQIVKEWEFDHESMVDSMEKIGEVLKDGND